MAAKPIRVSLVGFGTVGRWLARVLASDSRRLAQRYGVTFALVGLANQRDGFVYDAAGLDAERALALATGGGSLAELSASEQWPTALAGLRETEADILVEATASPSTDGEPGVAHMRAALDRRMAVVTSNKWAVALHGAELAALADARGVALRAEATVMSGTPALGALREGLAGATPVGLRGVLNATANFMLTEMANGASYGTALSRAQAAGIAERDPTADVDGHDSVAKLMIVSALVFGRPLRVDQVSRRGISTVSAEEAVAAAERGDWMRELASLELDERTGDPVARVEPTVVAGDDPYAQVDGTANAITCRAEPLGEVTVIGPGAGPALAGQGVLSDLIAAARSLRG